MPKNRSQRLVFALFVVVSLWIIGRNAYRRYQERTLETVISSGGDAAAATMLKQGILPANPQTAASLLWIAINNNEPNTVRELLLRGINPNRALSLYDLPLVAAVQHCPGAVELLLDKGAEVNPQRLNGDTPLTAVSYRHGIDTMRLLLDRGADVNLPNAHGMTPLMHAVASGNAEAVKLLLQRHADVNRVVGRGRQSLFSDADIHTGPRTFQGTALEMAVEDRNNSLVPLLLAAKPFQATKNKALNEAVAGGRAETVRVLLEAGARPVPQAQQWSRAVYIARQQARTGKSGYAEILALLHPFGVTPTPPKAEIEARNGDGQTALLVALERDNTKEAQDLLTQGANVNVVDDIGRTPLMEAAQHGSPLISALLEKGANPNAFTRTQAPPLYIAVYANNIALTKLLLAHGANPNLHRAHEQSLLTRARTHNQTAMVTLLQHAGAKE